MKKELGRRACCSGEDRRRRRRRVLARGRRRVGQRQQRGATSVASGAQLLMSPRPYRPCRLLFLLSPAMLQARQQDTHARTEHSDQNSLSRYMRREGCTATASAPRLLFE